MHRSLKEYIQDFHASDVLSMSAIWIGLFGLYVSTFSDLILVLPLDKQSNPTLIVQVFESVELPISSPWIWMLEARLRDLD